MKRKVFAFFTILIGLSQFACNLSFNNISSETNDDFHDVSINLSESSANDEQGDQLVYIIPTDFSFLSSLYRKCDYDVESSFNTLIGYLINIEDLEKWKKIDNDENILYALDEYNGVYNKYDNNRFKLISNGNNYELLAIRTSCLIVYEKVKGDANND